MSLFRAPLRLVDGRGPGNVALGRALRDWGAERGDAQAIARLERELTAALATPRAAPSVRAEPAAPAPACLLGLWLVNAAIALVLSWHEVPRELTEVTLPHSAGMSAVEVASRLGVGPRELASQEALDPLHMTVWR